MKRILFTILFVVLIASSLFGATGKGINWDPLIGLAGIILAPLFGSLVGKLFKKLNIDIDSTILEAAFAEAWKLIVQAEAKAKTGELTLEGRNTYVVDHVYAKLPAKTLKVVEKRFGSIENFVEAAFQTSALARKTSKK